MTTGHIQIFEHDVHGNLLAEHSNWYGSVRSQYDHGGRRTRLTWPDGFFVSYDYRVTGEMSAIRENGGAVLASFGYDELGRRTGIARGNGTSTSYGYDAASRLAALTQELAGTDNDDAATFRHNPAMQIASETRSNDRYQWTGGGNGTVTSAPNFLNQIASQNGVAFAYDAKGNLTSDGARAFAYTAENRLASGPGTNLYYDALGRLVHRSGPRTNFHYDGQDIIQETAPGGAVRRYVHGPGTDEPLVQYDGAGTADKRWLHADERGSIVALSDQSGNAAAINRYDEYGIPAQGNVGLFQYTGQIWLPELGVYSYKARMYDPKLGRFFQTDPIGYGDGMNMYAYVGADPVNFVDPTGNGQQRKSEKKPMCTGTRNCGPAGGLGVGNSGFVNGGAWLGTSLTRYASLEVFQVRIIRDDDGSVVKSWREVRGTGGLAGLLLTTAAGAENSGCRNHRLVCALWADPDVRPMMLKAWSDSKFGAPESQRNEHGFWITQKGSDYIPGPMLVGQGPKIDRIMQSRTPGADIFFHTHPFTSLSWGLSGLDAGILKRNPITMVIFAGSREGRNRWIVWDSPLKRGR